MNRSLIIVLGALALGAALFGGSFFLSQRVCRVCEAPPDDLAWLQKEFHLNAAEMVRIKRLHENYVTRCDAMCQMIANKKHDVETALNGATNVSPAVEKKLADLAACRAQCQSQMLRYFVDVSRVMPPAEGRRYLAEMKKMTLGFNGETAHPMSSSAGHEHGTD